MPKTIPADIVASYKELGGAYGVLHEVPFVGMRFKPKSDDDAQLPPGIPTFQFRDFPQKDLPQVPVHFGIRITNCEIPDKSTLAFLKQHDTLIALSLADTECGDEHVLSIAGHKAISYLDLSATKVTDKGLKCVLQLPSLSRLSVSHMSGIRDESVKLIASHPGLISINLDRTGVTDASLSLLPIRMSYISLSGTKVTNRALADLHTFRNLREFHLADTGITDEGLKALVKCDALESLDLYGTSVTGSGLLTLSKLKNLKRLSVGNTKVKTGLEALSALQGLTHLDLSRTGITDDEAKALAKCSSLQRLILANTKITDKTIAALTVSKSLTFVDVSNCDVSWDMIKQLKATIPKCQVSK